MMKLKLLCTKSRSGIDLPLDTTLTLDGHTMEVLGLAQTEYRDGMFWQWWIVEEDSGRGCGMIEVTRKNGGITIQGHAEYAPHGQDVVCAAVSTLVQTFFASVKELTTDEIKADMAAGKAVIQYGNLSKEARLLVDSFFVGIQMIADSYPENVRIV